MRRVKKIKWKVLIVLSTILLSIVFINFCVFAVEESDTWVIPDLPKNDIQETTQISDEYIYQEATLKKGTGSMNYRTTGYLM